jgi:putative component of membrane protein insertase Oxa1/YidC/SpoIIIJ protein YidD
MNDQASITSIIIIFFISVILISPIPRGLKADKMKGPPENQPKKQAEIYGVGGNTMLNIYQKWISPVKGGNTCPMHPACSQYAKAAFRMLPWYEAYTNSLDRLLRCGNDLSFYPLIKIKNHWYWYDPVLFEVPKQGAIIDKADYLFDFDRLNCLRDRDKCPGIFK